MRTTIDLDDLVGVARENSAFLATFDRNLPARLLPGGTQALRGIQ